MAVTRRIGGQEGQLWTGGSIADLAYGQQNNDRLSVIQNNKCHNNKKKQPGQKQQ